MKPIHFFLITLFSFTLSHAQNDDWEKYFPEQSTHPKASSQNLSKQKILSISRSSASGGRGGSSQYMYTMDSSKIVTKVSINSRMANIENSTTEHTYSITPGDWQQLTSSLDLNYFFSLPNRVGCPGCSDGGIDYIEIITLNTKHKVVYDYSENLGIKEFAALLPDLPTK